MELIKIPQTQQTFGLWSGNMTSFAGKLKKRFFITGMIRSNILVG